MTPYSNFFYFVILGVSLLPVIISGLLGKRLKVYNVLLTIGLLLLAFADDLNQLYSLFGYIIWEVILVRLYLFYRKKNNHNSFFHLSIVLSILPLLLVKSLPFFHISSIFGFLGISYITFKNVQMVIDIRDGSLTSFSLKEQISFLLFFPTISSGPIDRFKRFKKDFETVPTKEEYLVLLYNGIHKVFLGLLYKFIIGHLIYTEIIRTPYISGEQFSTNIIYMYAYSLYLFFDFAGYSNFAVGISYIMGIKTPENFNLPFISRNIKDFWNRWHMSLSFWFRDYVYMRFVFLVTKKKWIKNKHVTSYLGYVLLFLLMGVWHGLELHYLVYGLYHAMLIILFDLFDRKNKQRQFWKKNRFTHILSVVITFHAICFGFLIFSGRLF